MPSGRTSTAPRPDVASPVSAAQAMEGCQRWPCCGGEDAGSKTSSAPCPALSSSPRRRPSTNRNPARSCRPAGGLRQDPAAANTPDPLGQIRGPIAGAGQVGHDRCQCARTGPGSHQRNLRARPVQHLGTHRMALSLIAVQQRLIGLAPRHGGQLPTEVHRIADAEVQSLAAQRRMHVRGITCQQHTSAAIGRRLARSIGPCRGQVQCSDRCLAARHPPQQRLRGEPVQWRAMAGATIESASASMPGGLKLHIP